MYHHTKTSGDLGVLKAQVDLFEKGYIVCIPLTEHAPFDLVAFKDGTCLTVQVKTRSLNARGTIDVHFRSVWADANGVHSKPVQKSLVDVYCVYCPDVDRCFYFNPEQFEKVVSLRVRAPKNNQRKGVHFAKDYREVP